MVRLADLEPGLARFVRDFEVPVLQGRPWTKPPAPEEMRVALITTAGLRLTQDRRFAVDAGDYRVIPAEKADEVIIDHYDAAFDRLGFIEDSNVVFPLARLREMAAGGEIGSVADCHYSFMGAGDLQGMESPARALAAVMKQEGVNTVVLTPV